MQVKKKYGFHGNYDMFKGLAFSTSCQLPNEPYHLWILGILRFFFKSVFFFFFSFSFFSFLFFFFFFFGLTCKIFSSSFPQADRKERFEALSA